MKTAIIDYGSGNLHSAAKAFEKALKDSEMDGKIIVTADPQTVTQCDHIVLPGVGAYADCRKGLDNVDGMIDALNDTVINRARPFLGICVGTQLLATKGLEKSVTDGFDWIGGEVKEISPDDDDLKIPQIGWNTINVVNDHELLKGIQTGPDGRHAYFVHSYHLVANDRSHIIAECDYGGPVTAIVGRDNIIGTQFHPEKSQKLGLALIANFLRWKP